MKNFATFCFMAAALLAIYFCLTTFMVLLKFALPLILIMMALMAGMYFLAKSVMGKK